MRAALTVAPGRYTAPAEVERLLALVRPALEAQGYKTGLWLPEPLAWLDWLDAYEGEPRAMPEGVDVVVGFELPPSLRRCLTAWVDIRRHPLRFAGDFWSIEHAGGFLAGAKARPFAVELEAPARLAEYSSMGAFACQVSFDSAMVRGGRVIRPADALEGLRCFAHRFEAVFVAPHPVEPRGPWVDAALGLPNAVLSPWPTYELLRRVREVCTVTSSIGHEAPYFGARTTWLVEPWGFGAPVADLSDAGLWELLLSARGKARRARA